MYFYSARWAYDYEARRFQAPGIPGEDRSREFGQFSLERDPSHGPVVYLLLAPYDNLIPTLQDRYPGGQRFELREGDRLIYAAYVLE